MRYRPAVSTDQEAHAHLLGLLTNDVAHVPAHLLDLAVIRWAQQSRFMPKAAELIEMAHQCEPQRRKTSMEEHVEMMNARRIRHDIIWVIRNGDYHLEPVR